MTDRDAVWVVDSGGSKEAYIRWGLHWRHLGNTIEPSMCGGDAAFLSNYFDQLFVYLAFFPGVTSDVTWSKDAHTDTHTCPIGLYVCILTAISQANLG